jgi:hypothetical protein
MTSIPQSVARGRISARVHQVMASRVALALWLSGVALRYVGVWALLLSMVFLQGCGSDPVARIKSERAGDGTILTLEQALEKYPFFSKVTWSTYPGQQGRTMARATGIFSLDSLVGKTGNGRIFSGRDRMVLAKASVNLCYVLEYAYDKDAQQGVRTQMAVTISSMDWDKTAQLENEAVLAEIAQGVAGEATIKVVLDAADYCRSRPPSSPKRQ